MSRHLLDEQRREALSRGHVKEEPSMHESDFLEDMAFDAGIDLSRYPCLPASQRIIENWTEGFTYPVYSGHDQTVRVNEAGELSIRCECEDSDTPLYFHADAKTAIEERDAHLTIVREAFKLQQHCTSTAPATDEVA